MATIMATIMARIMPTIMPTLNMNAVPPPPDEGAVVKACLKTTTNPCTKCQKGFNGRPIAVIGTHSGTVKNQYPWCHMKCFPISECVLGSFIPRSFTPYIWRNNEYEVLSNENFEKLPAGNKKEIMEMIEKDQLVEKCLNFCKVGAVCGVTAVYVREFYVCYRAFRALR